MSIIANILEKTSYVVAREGLMIVDIINGALQGKIIVEPVSGTDLYGDDLRIDLAVKYVDKDFFEDLRVPYPNWMAAKLDWIPGLEVDEERDIVGDEMFLDFPFKDEDVGLGIKLQRMVSNVLHLTKKL